METLKAVGGFCLGLAVLCGMAFVAVALFAGIAWVSAEAFQYLGWIWQTALLLAIFVFLPLALFRSTRLAAAFGLLAASFTFGACVWIFGLIVTWSYWGLWAAFVGIGLFGIGVVPLGMIASAFHSDWMAVGIAVIGLGLTFSARATAFWLAAKVDRYKLERMDPPDIPVAPRQQAVRRDNEASRTVTEPKPLSQKPGAENREEEPNRPGRQAYGFKINEFIVYPAHGVGQILAIEEQEIAGAQLELFVVNFAKDKMTLRIPTKKVVNVGMRKLSDPATIRRAYAALGQRRHVAQGNWSRLAQEYEVKINSGDIVAIAEVLRDLYRPAVDPGQSFSERQLYEAALDRLSREIALVHHITDGEAVREVESLLIARPQFPDQASAKH